MRLKVFSLLLLLSINAGAVVLGYVTGNDYLKMDEATRTDWLVGVADGIMAESLFSDSQSEPWLGQCVKTHELRQLKAIFEKELSNKPESWHAPAALIFRTRIQEFCGAK